MSVIGDFIRTRLEESTVSTGPVNANNWKPTVSAQDRARVTQGMTGRHGAMSGSPMFNGLSLPNFGQMGDMVSSGLGNPMVAGVLGGAITGLPGALLGRALANRFGAGETGPDGPEIRSTSRSDLNDLEDRMGLDRRGFSSYRGSGGNVIGLIDPSSLGIYEGSGHDRSRAPQTSADRQMR